LASREFKLSPKEEQEIQGILKQSGSDAVYDRLRAVWEYSSGLPLPDIQQRYGCCRSSLLSWCRIYRQYGVEALVSHCTGGNNARLTDAQIADLTRRLRKQSPRQVFGNGCGANGHSWTVPDLYRAVRLWYGVVYRSKTSYYNLLRRFGPKLA
jgi:transposase